MRYGALVDLAGEDPTRGKAKAAYAALRVHPAVVELLTALDQWPPAPASGAYEPKAALWKLQTLADFGLRRDDPRVAALAERLLAAQSEDGGFLHGGFDHTTSWHARPYICISHVVTYALARFGYLDDRRVQRAYGHLTSWQRLDGGWHPNKTLLPGEKREAEPSCPFGTANVLRAATANPALRESDVTRRASDYLLTCWERRKEPWRPVGFGMGSTWEKVQYPFVQYQLLKTLDTLSTAPAALGDARFGHMLDLLESKRGADGTWTADGITKPWVAFDFGQKKAPSGWITFLALRTLQRAGRQAA